MVNPIEGLLLSVWGGWMAAGSRLTRRQLRARVQSRIVPRVGELRSLRGREFDACLRRVREAAAQARSHRHQSAGPAAQRTDREGPRLIARKCMPLVRGKNEERVLDEAIAVGTVLMGESLGIWLHPNQLLAALALGHGYTIQLDTGEGKTFVGALRAFLDHLFGLRTMVIVPNSYLATRDAKWMSPFYETVGMKVACADGTPFDGPHPGAYEQDVCYVSISQLMADHVHHVHCRQIEEWVDCQPESVVIDEVDAVLLDDAGTGHAVNISSEPDVYREAQLLVSELREGKHYTKDPYCSISAEGYRYLEGRRPDFPHLARLADTQYHFHVRVALAAVHQYRRDVDYVVGDSRVIAIDPHTGRQRRNAGLGFGVQQAVEAKEGVPLSFERRFVFVLLASSVIARARHVCGMSGSTRAERITFRAAYGCPIMVIPPHRPTGRRVYPDEIVLNREAQIAAVIRHAVNHQARGQPVLIGTQTVRDAEEVAARLQRRGLRVGLVTAKREHEEAEIFRQAVRSGAITVAARMAGRGVDIKVDRKALDSGGLAVIGMGRFSVRRLDDQLAGRTGRQGEPGDVRFILSLEDDLMRIFGGEWVRGILTRLGMKEGEAIESRMVSSRIHSAQARIARAAFYRLRYRVLMDCLIDPIRTEYERQRHTLLLSAERHGFIRDLFSRVVRDAAHEPSHWLWDALPTSIPHPEGATNQESSLRRTIDAILDEYGVRRLNAEPDGALREQHILVRCLDFQWGMLYLDWDRHLEMGSPQYLSLFHDIRFINRRAAAFRTEYAQQAVYYLLNIDRDDVVAQCYYWKGTMLPVTTDGTGRPGLGRVAVPQDQAYEPPPEGPAPDADEALLLDPAGPPPPKPRGPGMQTAEEASLERLQLKEQRGLRWRSSFQTLILALGGGGIVWLMAAWPGTPPAGDVLSSGIAQTLMDQADRLVALSAGRAHPELPVCLLSAVLLYHVFRRRNPGLANVLLLPTALLLSALAAIWVDRPFWLLVGSTGLLGLLLILARTLLWTSGIGLIGGLACVSGLFLLSRNQLYAAGEGPAFWVAAAILASTAALGTASFRVRSHRGWDHTVQGPGCSEHPFVTGSLDDLVPFLVAWLWATCVGAAVAAVLAPHIHAVSPLAATTLTLVGYVAVASLLGLRRSRWRHRSEGYTTLERQWQGTLVSGETGIAAEQLAARARKRDLVLWIAAPAAAALAVGLGVSSASIAVLLTHAALVGIPLGLLVRRLRAQYSGASDLREDDSDSEAMSGNPGLRSRIRAEFARAGGWWVWAPFALALIYLMYGGL